MTEARCEWCEAALVGAVRFCTACGAPLRSADVARAALGDAHQYPQEALPRRPAVVVAEPEPLFVHCPACEASNAASRARCGRCGVDLRTGAPRGAEAHPDDTGAGDAVPVRDEGSDSSVFTVLIVLFGLAMLAALTALLVARGVGPFGTPEPAAGGPAPVPVVAVHASTTLPPSGDVTYGPEHVVDGDRRTAWIEGASGDPAGEWVELRLAEPVPVARLLLWNGFQDGERFAEYGRISRLRLVLEDTNLSADVVDVDGPQAIDLPEPVVTDLVRLEITGARRGSRYADAALSGVEVHAEVEATP